MQTETKQPREPKPVTPIAEIAADYPGGLVVTTRRRIALRRKFLGTFIAYRRAAKVGPNTEFFLVAVKEKGRPLQCHVLPAVEVDRLVAEVTDAEVEAWYDTYAEYQTKVNDALGEC